MEIIQETTPALAFQSTTEPETQYDVAPA